MSNKAGEGSAGPTRWNVHRLNRNKPAEFSGMEIIFLGTSAGGPQAGRNATSVAVRASGHSQPGSQLWLFDCGEGTNRQLQNSTLSHSQVSRIFVSHLHGDHIWGIVSVISGSLAERSPDDSEMTVNIYGPVGLYAVISCLLEISQVGLPRSTRVVVTELQGLAEWHANEQASRKDGCGRRRQKQYSDAWTKTALSSFASRKQIQLQALQADHDGAWTVHEDEWSLVRCAPLRHTVPCVGYVIQEKARKLKIDAEKASHAGLRPGPSYRLLQQGKDVTLSNGNIIKALDVTLKPDPPRKLVICGDTASPTNTFAQIAQDADILVHEATLSDAEIEKAVKRGHSTPGMAGNFARSIRAKWLVLTHFSARYTPGGQRHAYQRPLDGQNTNTIDILLREAKRAFNSKHVLAAHDFMALSIPRAGCSSAHHSSMKKEDNVQANLQDGIGRKE